MRNYNRLKEQKLSFSLFDITKDALIAFIMCLPAFLVTGTNFLVMFGVLFITALFGDFVRKWTRPNAISTKGNASDVLKNKIYWEIGPQFWAIILLLVFFSEFFKSCTPQEQETSSTVEITPASKETIQYRD